LFYGITIIVKDTTQPKHGGNMILFGFRTLVVPSIVAAATAAVAITGTIVGTKILRHKKNPVKAES